MRNASRIGLWLAIAALMVGWVGMESTAAAAHPRPRLSISVLSGRADLVSGGSALVAINLPRRADARRVEVALGHRDVTTEFAFRGDGRFEGLVRGFAL